MPFLNTLHLSCKPGSETYTLDKRFTYRQACIPLNPYYKVQLQLDIITVPTGFETDFASIPRLFWNILPKDSKYIREAAVIHDWLYTSTTMYTRGDADIILREAMLELGASRFLAYLVYWSVRVFGGSHWKDLADC